jgi:hypothetical protein
MELASPKASSSQSLSQSSAPHSASQSQSLRLSAPRAKAKKKIDDGGKSLLGILMSGESIDVGRGFRLFD